MTQVLASEYSFIDIILTFVGHILNEIFVGAHTRVDLPQVDLMNFRVEYVRPRSAIEHVWFSRRGAAERATKSRTE